jgi:hypothetical protein
LGLRSRPLVLFLNIAFFVVLPWLTALGYLFAYLAGVNISITPALFLLIVPPLSVLYFSLIPLWVTRGARSLSGEHCYRFSEEQIWLSGPGFQNRVEWSLLTRCFGSGWGLLLMSGSAPLITIPGRALSPAARTELRELLISKKVELGGPWKD